PSGTNADLRRPGCRSLPWAAGAASTLSERPQDLPERTLDAGKDRDVAQRVPAGLDFAEPHHQRLKPLGMVGGERDHELLVVEAEGIGGMELDVRKLVPDADVV